MFWVRLSTALSLQHCGFHWPDFKPNLPRKQTSIYSTKSESLKLLKWASRLIKAYSQKGTKILQYTFGHLPYLAVYLFFLEISIDRILVFFKELFRKEYYLTLSTMGNGTKENVCPIAKRGAELEAKNSEGRLG